MMVPMFRSTRTAIIVVLLLALLPAFAIIVLTGNEHISYLRENAKENLLRQVETVTEIQDRITVFTRQTLTALAGLPIVRNMDAEAVEPVLEAVRKANTEFINFTLTDIRGIVVASALLVKGENLSDRKHLKDAVLRGGFGAGEYVLSRALNEPSFSFAQAVFNEEGRMTGILGAIYRLTVYSAVLDNLNLPEESILGITDSRGVRRFFHPKKETNPVGVPIKSDMWNVLTEGEDSGTTIMDGSDNVRRIYAYKKLRLYPREEPYMYFVLGVPEAAVMAPARAVLRRNIVLLALILAVVPAIALALSELVFGRRLKAIIAATARLHRGDFSARTGVPGDASDLGRVADALDRMAEALEQREVERREAALDTERALKEKELLLREIHHRVKNNLQIILSLVRLQNGTGGPPEDLSRHMTSRVNAMALVHEMLYQSEDFGRVDIASYVSRLARLVVHGDDGPAALELEIKAEPLGLSLDRAIPFGLVLNELLTNACKHAVRDRVGGKLTVELGKNGPDIVLTVRDNGPGIPEDLDLSKTPGLGVRLVRGLADQLGGSLCWENRGGAVFILRFPD
jgi:two-component sensor histidine kinase